MASSGEDNGSLVERRELCKHFHMRGRSVRVLDGVQLSVRRGEIVVTHGGFPLEKADRLLYLANGTLTAAAAAAGES